MRAGFQDMRGKPQYFFFQPDRSSVDSGSDIDGAAATERTAAERNRGCIPFDEANLLEAHSPKIRRYLRVDCLMTLSVPGGTRGNHEFAG